MRVIALTLALFIPIDNPSAWRFDVSPQFAVPIYVGSAYQAVTLPFVTFYRPYPFEDELPKLTPYRVMLFNHEAQHYRQERALGPWFWLSYAATLGQPFEPDESSGWIEWGDTWLPSPEMEDNYPFLRVSARGLEVMPDYFNPLGPAVYTRRKEAIAAAFTTPSGLDRTTSSFVNLTTQKP